MFRLAIAFLALLMLPNAALAEDAKKEADPPKREYIQVEVAPKGSPAGTKASWDNGKQPPPKPLKRRIREALGFGY